MATIIARWRNRITVILHDLFMIPLAWMAAYWLRFNLGAVPEHFLHRALLALPLVCLIQAAACWAFGLYRGVWRFASIPDLVRIIKAAVIGVALTATAIFSLTRMTGVPRAVLPLYGILLITFLGGSRFLFRWLGEYNQLFRKGRRVLIVGAGSSGDGLARDLARDKNYWPVAFVDDNEKLQGQEIRGVPVKGSTRSIPELVHKLSVDLVLIALPSARAADMRRIVELCEEANAPYRTLPAVNDLASGRINISALREVLLEDLLGRDPVKLDWQAINQVIASKVVLVTGAGGSIGSELCRQIARMGGVASLVIVERNEFNLYALELELRRKFPDLNCHFKLADVADRTAISYFLKQYRPDIIFHAAAYKHVPMLENQVRIAVQNNVIGTRIIAEEAIASGVDHFVLISTDKAVNPANIMGLSKRAAEVICQNFAMQSGTQFITVRFGNVLGSAGSVVPLFRKQLKQGGPLTVTHPDVTRYFMTIPEACQLILQATAMGYGGEIFVLDMGEPIKISYLAEQMIKLAGKTPGDDIQIQYTGLRPGEKLHEELFHEREKLQPTSHKKILQAEARGLELAALLRVLDELAQACTSYDEPAMRGLLLRLVPEFSKSAPIIKQDKTGTAVNE